MPPDACMGMLTDISGWAGAALIVVAFASTSDRRMTFLAVCGFTAMAIYLGLLGAWTGTAAYLLAAASYLVVFYRGADPRRGVLFSAATVGLGLLTWDGWLHSGLFMLGNTVAFMALATMTGLRMRLVMAVVTTLFLVAFAMLGSLPGIVLEICVLCGSMRAVSRLWRMQKPSCGEQQQRAAVHCALP